MKTIKSLVLTLAAASALTACGGGGGGGSTGGVTPPPTPTPDPVTTAPAGTTQAVPTYTAGSAQLQMLNAINSYRQQCGFPAFQQNTMLDRAAQNHAEYMAANGATPGHIETAGNPGFTGAKPQDRAIALGWPSGLGVGEVAAGFWNGKALTPAENGQALLDTWSSGPYHQTAIADYGTLLGSGVAQKDWQGSPTVLGGLLFGSSTYPPSNITTSGNVLTFPCQGSTGLPYKGAGEIPVPPGTSGPWGTPVTVTGNPTDTVTLTSGTMIAAGSSTVITLTVLTSENDPAKLVKKNLAVAYPLAPLAPNTTYSVNLNGTVNGVPFTRSFTFTTNSTVG